MPILDTGLTLKMRPMTYPHFYNFYKDAIKNTWTVEEVSFLTDVSDIRDKLKQEVGILGNNMAKI